MRPIDYFPYRNDTRKVLIPYLRSLPEDAWFAVHPDYPNSIAWVIRHIAESEDGWINEIALQGSRRLADIPDNPGALLGAYKEIRAHTDRLLASMSAAEGDEPIEVPEFPDGWKPPSPPTRRWAFHHVFAHEAHHAGQIGVIARLIGHKGPPF
ncbi:DinB family protein [Paenibacillus thermotolerans]|uniref:DinB family protein n=1 Tax=Paenibacillus thermotolerans TaxID=3027807 RepID=UPI0023678832|nr:MULTISPECIES: DinB family protein [unclassified Paenibacillus]